MVDSDFVIIDGDKFNNLAEFVQYLNEIAFNNIQWNGNLDAFNDLISGGFDNIIENRSIKIINTRHAKEALGKGETQKWLDEHILTCHPSNAHYFSDQLSLLVNNKADLIFDKILKILKSHSKYYSTDDTVEIPKLLIE